MLKKDPWWLFIVLFALVIASVQSLGWLTRAAQAQSPSRTKSEAISSPAAPRHGHGETKHWRALVMQP